MTNILFIDTSKSNEISVSLSSIEYNKTKTCTQQFGSQVLLDLITKILKEAKLELKDLNQIKVATGPGSFTGLKVGVSVANALAYSLNIPVNGKKLETDLQYS